MIEHKIFSLNSCGIKSPKKFFSIIEKCYHLARGTYFFLCVQETKILALPRSHEAILEQYKLSYHLVPAINCSGGLITIWREEIKTNEKRFQSRDHSALTFPNINLVLINKYLNPNDYTTNLRQLSSSLTKIEPRRFVVLTGYFNAFNHDPRNTSNALRSEDDRIKRFAKLKPVIEKALLFDIAVELDVQDFTHYDKRTSSFSRIDYFFTNYLNYSDMKIHRNNLSDHMLLELNNETEEKERGQSFWKMNDTILVENKNYIREELKQFGDLCPIGDTYEELMCHIRDVCQALAINKSRVINSKMKGSLHEEKDLREIIQQGKTDQTILNRNNATISQINEHENNKQRLSFKNFKKSMQSCETGNARDLKTWSKTKNSTNSITSLKVGDSVTSNQEEIIKIFENHFSKLYKSKNKSSFDSLLDQLQKQEIEITTENEITLEEVKKAIDKLNADSSPGSDGITSNFYKVFK